MLPAIASTAGPGNWVNQKCKKSRRPPPRRSLFKFVRWNRRRVFRSGRFRLQMAGLATAFVLTLALLFLSYAYVRHRHNQALDDSHRALPIGLDHPEKSTDPVSLLGEADRLYWLNNGPKAAPLYARAESLFAERGDARNELYAKVGRLRSEAETMSFVDLSRFIERTTAESRSCGATRDCAFGA